MGTSTSPIPLCFLCKRYQDSYQCEAFPQGIPADVIASRVDHRRPLAGDQGLQFAAVSPAAVRYAEDLFPEPRRRRFEPAGWPVAAR